MSDYHEDLEEIMHKEIKRRRKAKERIVRAAKRYIEEERADSPRIYMGKPLFQAMTRLGSAVDALYEVKI